MIQIELLKKEIVERLKPLDPEKIILFGSYAWGTPNKDSDIDLYVVTKDNYIPVSFKDNMELKLRIAMSLNDIMSDNPTDLIVHTKKMHEKFLSKHSYFSKKIMSDGVSLI